MKLQEVEVKKLGQQMVDFVDDVRDLTNNGKFAHPIVGLVPAWTADNGEMVFFDAGAATTDRRIYVRLSSSWVLFAQILGNGAPSNPGGIEGSIQYNSGGVFGGDVFYLRSLLSNYVALTGAFSIVGTSQQTDLHITTTVSNKSSPWIDVRRSNGFRAFAVDTNDCVMVRAGSIGASGQGVLSLGIGNRPSFASDSVQLFCIEPTNEHAALAVQPEGIGSHHLLGQVVVFSGADVVIRNIGTLSDGAAGVVIEGGTIADSPASLSFRGNGEGASYILQYSRESSFPPYDGTLPPRYRRLSIASSTVQANASTASYISFEDSTVGNLTVEDPSVVFSSNTVNLANATNLVTQRFVFIDSSFVGTSSGGGVVESVSHSATVYIAGAPQVAHINSVNLINRYALWVDEGDVRCDGALIVGGSTITPTPFVVNTRALFTTTGIGVASNNAGEITLLRGVIGTTSLVANTFSEGRTIRLDARGYYNTPAVPDNLTIRVKLGGTTVLSTGSRSPSGLASTLAFQVESVITCITTGGSGTVFAQGEFPHLEPSGLTSINWAMTNNATTVINTTGANIIEITAQWSGASSGSQLFLTNAIGELLN